MARPKKNKKAEIKQRRKARKAQERIDYLKHRERTIKAMIKMMAANAETMQKLAGLTPENYPAPSSEPLVSPSTPSSEPAPQNNQ